MSFDTYASLDEAWQDDLYNASARGDIGGSAASTAPTCRQGKTGNKGSPWCALYHDGYSGEIDNIMDMYTPGDAIPGEVRFHHAEWSRTQAPSKDTSGPMPYREAEAKPQKKAVRFVSDGGSSPMASLEAFSSKGQAKHTDMVMPFGASAYDPGTAFAPFDVFDDQSAAPRAPPQRAPESSSKRRPDAAARPQKEAAATETYEAYQSRRTDDDGQDDDENDDYDYARPRAAPSPKASREKYIDEHPTAPLPERKAKSAFREEENEKEKEEKEAFGALSQHQPHPHPQPATTNYLDMALYVLSGVMLIFVMEQFVQIGLHMR